MKETVANNSFLEIDGQEYEMVPMESRMMASELLTRGSDDESEIMMRFEQPGCSREIPEFVPAEFVIGENQNMLPQFNQYSLQAAPIGPLGVTPDMPNNPYALNANIFGGGLQAVSAPLFGRQYYFDDIDVEDGRKYDDDDIEDIINKVIMYNPNIFRKFMRYGIPYNTAKRMIARIVRVTLIHCDDY